MKRWEYNSGTMKDDSILNLKMFDSYGQDGWELIQIVGGIAYFKRPEQSESDSANLCVVFRHPLDRNPAVAFEYFDGASWTMKREHATPLPQRDAMRLADEMNKEHESTNWAYAISLI